MAKKKTSGKRKFPKLYHDKENNFVSIRLAEGVEAKSYSKNDFIFLENSRGKIIEIQILNYKLTVLNK